MPTGHGILCRPNSRLRLSEVLLLRFSRTNKKTAIFLIKTNDNSWEALLRTYHYAEHSHEFFVERTVIFAYVILNPRQDFRDAFLRRIVVILWKKKNVFLSARAIVQSLPLWCSSENIGVQLKLTNTEDLVSVSNRLEQQMDFKLIYIIFESS